MRRKPSTSCAICLVWLTPLHAAATLQAVPARLASAPGPFATALFGAEVALLGDVDGDGRAEWMVARAGSQPGFTQPVLEVHSGRDGALRYAITGDGTLGSFCLQALVDVGDVDGDGSPDIGFANSNTELASPNVGSVAVHSGRTGARLFLVAGVQPFGAFGASLANLGDVNGDRIADLAVGAVGTLNENVWFVSGADGRFLRRVRGPTGLGDIEFGWSVAATGDLNADGFPDCAVGTRSGGFVDVVSGTTGALLRRVRGGSSFGQRLADLGDLDGDGRHELLVSEPKVNAVHLLAGKSGATMARVTPRDGVSFGSAIATAADLDGDRAADFLVGDEGFAAGRGRVQAYSSRTLQLLFEVVGAAAGDRLGASVAGGKDLDGDGWPDFAAGAPGVDAPARNAGEAATWSGVPVRRR